MRGPLNIQNQSTSGVLTIKNQEIIMAKSRTTIARGKQTILYCKENLILI
jgi:hypothetical protein